MEQRGGELSPGCGGLGWHDPPLLALLGAGTTERETHEDPVCAQGKLMAATLLGGPEVREAFLEELGLDAGFEGRRALDSAKRGRGGRSG